MSAQDNTAMSRSMRHARGFTLVELMITVGIAVFLLGGLATIVQNVRQANLNQQALVQLQDSQRFAMTVLTDVIQMGGHYPNATGETQASALNAAAAPAGAPGQVAMQLGQAFDGFHSAGGYPVTPDSLTVRFRTTGGDGLIMCDGSQNNNLPGTEVLETNVFTVVPPAGNTPGQLLCSLNGAAAVPIVNGVQSLEIFYGVNRNAPLLNYNVDTYLTADVMNAGIAAGGDWMNISSVRIVLTFTNPLAGQANQPPTLTFERVVPVMARAGVHS
jgi:type IV pilus assembly protein PilW